MAKTPHNSESGEMLCGACKSAAEYFDADAPIVRIV